MSRTTLQVPFIMDENSKMSNNHPQPPSFVFPQNNNHIGQIASAHNQSVYPLVSGLNFKFNVVSQNGTQSKIQSNNHMPLQGQLKRNKNDQQFQFNIKTGHKLVNLQSENSYEFVAKNFPFLQESEIKNIITEDSNSNSVENSAEKPKRVTFEKQQQFDRQLNQLKHKNAVKPFMEEQQKKLGISICNNQIIQNPQPKPSKKRGRRAIEQDLLEDLILQPKENQSIDKEMNSQPQLSQDSNQIPQQQAQQLQIQEKPPQISEAQSDLQLQDTPNDKFFDTLESNLQQFLHDRHSAYAFISNQLKTFKDDSCALETKDLQNKLEYHQWATDILKKGVKIQNRMLNENEAKAKNFDELFSKYKVVEQKNTEMQNQLNQLKTLNEFLLRNQIGDPHSDIYNNNGSFGGFGGGVC